MDEIRKKQIDAIVESLTEEERALLQSKFGDLKKPELDIDKICRERRQAERNQVFTSHIKRLTREDIAK